MLGAFCYPFYVFLNFYFSLRRAQAARGPYFLLLQKVGKDRRKGVSPPCGSPDQSGVLDAPLWKPPSLRWRGKFGRTPRRFAAGASVLDFWAASACALAPAAGAFWGLTPPGPLPFPLGDVCRSCAPVGGSRPLAPAFPKGKSLLVMREGAWDNVRNGFAGKAFANPARKLQPQRGEEFRQTPIL